MSPGHTTERVYSLLKAQITSGERRPGERLDPARLAADLHASATPVRDALHQLFGERMVDAWPREGFKVPVPTEAGLRDLYGWNGDLVGLVLRASRPADPARELIAPPEEAADAAHALFAGMAASFGNAEHQAAIVQASNRLRRARAAETELFVDLAAEHIAMMEAWSAGRLGDLRAMAARYHRRRQREVAPIVAVMLRARS